MDGFGLNPTPENNAVFEAETPNLDRYFSTYPVAELEASGRAIGLPMGQMGNSEVGHMTIGSGSIVKQDLVRISDSIKDKSFFENPALVDAIESAKQRNRPVHLLGLVSDGGVHSHIDHLMSLIDLCASHQVVPQVHMISDGRDTGPQTALNFLPALEQKLDSCGGFIGSISGRFYVLDRDKRWDRVQLAWDAIVGANGIKAESASTAIQKSYQNGCFDEFIKPTILPKFSKIEEGDELIFFNFRNDRTREITAALCSDQFDDFNRGADYHPIKVTCMTLYDEKLDLPVAFQPIRPGVTLGGLISEAGCRQLHCAETEKYAHVTFFFNGGREACFEGEEHKLINSPRVATYDLMPEMSASEVTDAMIAALKSQTYDFLVVNYANGDMVGHTAVRNAVIKAVEVLDQEVGRLLDVAIELGYSAILTADHGNCDEMVDPLTGEPHTQHTQYPVPCMVVDKQTKLLAAGGNLSAIAPTVLQLMGIPQPKSMTGKSLILDDWPV
ncbi:MAG: 2,3-bisphosphoglycerate-independent phosphoglycerate mutase [Gammaproteobacteria bacterium]|jgi:2,3-bisphosphoglycerate-independent phosphoglycerate mutase